MDGLPDEIKTAIFQPAIHHCFCYPPEAAGQSQGCFWVKAWRHPGRLARLLHRNATPTVLTHTPTYRQLRAWRVWSLQTRGEHVNPWKGPRESNTRPPSCECNHRVAQMQTVNRKKRFKKEGGSVFKGKSVESAG